MSDYWTKRQRQKILDVIKDADLKSEDISKYYSNASFYLQNEIQGIFDTYKSRYGLSESEARKLLNQISDEKTYSNMLNALRNSYGDDKKELLKELESPAYRYRIQRLEEMQNQVDNIMQNGYKVEKEVATDSIIDTSYNSYYKDIFNLQKDTGVSYSFANLDSKIVDQFIKSQWSGKNFSSRIWANTSKTAEALKDEMMIGILTGKSEKKMGEDIANLLGVEAYKGRRLVRTESAAITSEVDKAAYKSAGVETLIFRAVHDFRTSSICQSMGGERIKVSEAKEGVNIPPMHPNCRSWTEPVIDEEITSNMKRRNRNPITGKSEVVDGNETYNEWLKRMQEDHGVDTVELFKKKTLNLSSDEKQYKKYKELLGSENVPNTLANFQQLKYNNPDEWNELKKKI